MLKPMSMAIIAYRYFSLYACVKLILQCSLYEIFSSCPTLNICILVLIILLDFIVCECRTDCCHNIFQFWSHAAVCFSDAIDIEMVVQ